jgi:hypothetical protein
MFCCHVSSVEVVLLCDLSLAWHAIQTRPLFRASSPAINLLNYKFSQASQKCDDSDWLYKTFLVLCQYVPSQGIVPKLHKHLSSENVQIQRRHPGGIQADS